MLFKILVVIEFVLFIITGLLLAILSVAVGKMKNNQFVRLMSFPSSMLKSLNEIKEQLRKTAAVLSGVRAKAITSSIIAIIALTGIWFLLYKKYIHVPIDAETIFLGIAAIAPVPIVIALTAYCIDKMIKRADEFSGGKGE